jgi:hypothetical protein
MEEGVQFNGTLEMTQAVKDMSRDTPLRSIDDSDVSPLQRAAA